MSPEDALKCIAIALGLTDATAPERVLTTTINRLATDSQPQPNTQRNPPGETSMTLSKKNRRGFASMDDDIQREIASKGGRAAHAMGRAHEFTPAEAQSAGRKGGTTVSRDREHMAEIGRIGGQTRARNRALRERADS